MQPVPEQPLTLAWEAATGTARRAPRTHAMTARSGTVLGERSSEDSAAPTSLPKSAHQQALPDHSSPSDPSEDEAHESGASGLKRVESQVGLVLTWAQSQRMTWQQMLKTGNHSLIDDD